jgi:hypothetical protein
MPKAANPPQAAPLPTHLQLLHGQVIASEVQHRVQQGAGVAIGQHKAVPAHPLGGLGVVAHDLAVQHVSNGGAAHGGARVARLCPARRWKASGRGQEGAEKGKIEGAGAGAGASAAPGPRQVAAAQRTSQQCPRSARAHCSRSACQWRWQQKPWHVGGGGSLKKWPKLPKETFSGALNCTFCSPSSADAQSIFPPVSLPLHTPLAWPQSTGLNFQPQHALPGLIFLAPTSPAKASHAPPRECPLSMCWMCRS